MLNNFNKLTHLILAVADTLKLYKKILTVGRIVFVFPNCTQ